MSSNERQEVDREMYKTAQKSRGALNAAKLPALTFD